MKYLIYLPSIFACLPMCLLHKYFLFNYSENQMKKLILLHDKHFVKINLIKNANIIVSSLICDMLKLLMNSFIYLGTLVLRLPIALLSYRSFDYKSMYVSIFLLIVMYVYITAVFPKSVSRAHETLHNLPKS